MTFSFRTYLEVQWLRLCRGWDVGSIPGWGTNIPYDAIHGQKKKEHSILKSLTMFLKNFRINKNERKSREVFQIRGIKET